MRELFTSFLFIAELWCFSREILSTNHSKSLIRYTSSHNFPHFFAIEYPSFVIPHLMSTPLYGIIECETSTIAVFYLKRESTLDILFEKDLCKIWQYSPCIDYGIDIRAGVYAKDRLVWIDTFKDWAVIPDFTVQFISFGVFGAIFSLLFKVYCNTEKVLTKRKGLPFEQ